MAADRPRQPPPAHRDRHPAELTPATRSDAAAKIVLRPLLASALRHAPAVARGGDADALHDLRVAVRRSRVVLGQLKGAFPPRRRRPLGRDLAALGRRTGPARDLDVLLIDLETLLAERPALGAGLEPLLAALRHRRRRRQRVLAAALEGAFFRRLQQRWQRLIETPPPQRPSAPAARRPIGELLVERLEHRRRKLLRHAAAAAAPRHLHRLRISGKKLRYLLEAFAPLLDRRRLTPLRRRLKAVQDDLGRWHDLEIQLQLLHRIAGEHDLHRPAAALHRHLGDALAASRRRLEDSLPALVRALEGSHPASLLAPAASG